MTQELKAATHYLHIQKINKFILIINTTLHNNIKNKIFINYTLKKL